MMIFVTREMLKTNKLYCNLQHTVFALVITWENMYCDVRLVGCYFTREISHLFHLEFLVFHWDLYNSNNVHIYVNLWVFSEAIKLSWNKILYINILSKKIYCANRSINYLAFQSFDYEHFWWRLFQKCVMHTKLHLYVFMCHAH